MIDLNDLKRIALENAEKRQKNGANITTDTCKMIKHCATEVIESAEAYTEYSGIKNLADDINAADIEEIFAPEEVDRIYLNFSDPWPKDRHARRRLTSSEFLARYDQFLAKDGRIEFKTDNQDLFTFSLEEIEESSVWKLDASTRDLHNDAVLNEGNVMTEYERNFSSQGMPIHALRVVLKK